MELGHRVNTARRYVRYHEVQDSGYHTHKLYSYRTAPYSPCLQAVGSVNVLVCVCDSNLCEASYFFTDVVPSLPMPQGSYELLVFSDSCEE